MTVKKRDTTVRAYVLVAGQHYPPMARQTEVKRGHELTASKPEPLSPVRFRWLVVPSDRHP